VSFFEKTMAALLLVCVGIWTEASFGHPGPSPQTMPNPVADEWLALVHERCGHDDARCEDLTRQCMRACTDIGGRMVELAPRFTSSVDVRHDVCVCASPEGIDRYSGDFSEHVRVTQTFCLDSE